LLSLLPAAADFLPFGLAEVLAAVAPGFLDVTPPAAERAGHWRSGVQDIPRISVVVAFGSETVQLAVGDEFAVVIEASPGDGRAEIVE
jgi:hypothetical protein